MGYCSSVCNAVRGAGKTILNGMDECAIRLNRFSPCVVKTVSAATIIGVPFILFWGSFMTYIDKIPGAVAVSLTATCIVLPPMGLTFGLLFIRYGWMMEPNRMTFLPPIEIKARLVEDAKNLNLPEEYRLRVKDLLQEISRREELVEIQPSALHV
ncbi:MAG: hypothetical protein V4487_04985 [Chlamydiota bacterium]